MSKNCFECDKSIYIGEGDHICEDTNDLVIDEWTPTHNFCQCKSVRGDKNES